MLVSDSKGGHEETHSSDSTGRGRGPGGTEIYDEEEGVMITAVHLGCKSVTIPMDPKRSKGTFLGKRRVWTDMSVPLFI